MSVLYVSFSILLLLLVPSTVFVLSGGSSLSSGLILSSLIILLVNKNHIFFCKLINRNVLVFLCVFLTYTLVQSSFISLPENSKPLQSLVIFSIVLGPAIFFVNVILNMPPRHLNRVLVGVSIFLITLGFIELIFGFHFSVYAKHEKPVFPFSEQSHYALAVGLISGPAFYNKKIKTKLLVIGLFLIQSLWFPNLTMLVFTVLLSILFFLKGRPVLLLSLFSVSVISLYYMANNVSASGGGYFLSRLAISSDTSNLTSLVFLQGWEQSWIALLYSKGMGVGFQLLGNEPSGYFSDIIVAITHGLSLNRDDGGFLAAKFIGEFGLVGIIILLYHLVLCFRFIFNPKIIDNIETQWRLDLCYSIIFMYSVELYFRGYGYFSPGFVLCLSAVYSIFYMYKKRRDYSVDNSQKAIILIRYL